MVYQAHLNYIKDSDVVLASYPRSGNTWLINLLHSIDVLVLEGYKQDISKIFSVDDIPDNRVDLYAGLMDFKKRKKGVSFPFRVIKTHSLPEREYRRAIYIYRDGRDSVVSYYHFNRRFGNFTGGFLDFLRKEDGFLSTVCQKATPCGAWAEHVFRWVKEKNFLMPVHYVCYEELKKDTLVALKGIVEFLGIVRTEDSLKEAITKCEFSRLKRNEEEKVGNLTDSNLYFFRSAETGQWKEYFLEGESLEIFQQEAGEALEYLGYYGD